jgi:hypothetical protein
MDKWMKQLEAREFRQIEHDGSRHVLFQSGDGGIVAYFIPPKYLRNSSNIEKLRTSIQDLPVISESTNEKNGGRKLGFTDGVLD